jgi:hypothetical protein
MVVVILTTTLIAGCLTGHLDDVQPATVCQSFDAAIDRCYANPRRLLRSQLMYLGDSEGSSDAAENVLDGFTLLCVALHFGCLLRRMILHSAGGNDNALSLSTQGRMSVSHAAIVRRPGSLNRRALRGAIAGNNPNDNQPGASICTAGRSREESRRTNVRSGRHRVATLKLQWYSVPTWVRQPGGERAMMMETLT